MDEISESIKMSYSQLRWTRRFVLTDKKVRRLRRWANGDANKGTQPWSSLLWTSLQWSLTWCARECATSEGW